MTEFCQPSQQNVESSTHQFFLFLLCDKSSLFWMAFFGQDETLIILLIFTFNFQFYCCGPFLILCLLVVLAFFVIKSDLNFNLFN